MSPTFVQSAFSKSARFLIWVNAFLAQGCFPKCFFFPDTASTYPSGFKLAQHVWRTCFFGTLPFGAPYRFSQEQWGLTRVVRHCQSSGRLECSWVGSLDFKSLWDNDNLPTNPHQVELFGQGAHGSCGRLQNGVIS